LKTLKERLKNQNDRTFDFGLVAALAEGEPWTIRIQQLYENLNNSGAFAYHRIANFVTHIAPAPQPLGALRVVNGRLVLPIPDPPQRTVYTWTELTFSDGRDARTFGTAALDAVDEFITGMLTAFEEAKVEINVGERPTLSLELTQQRFRGSHRVRDRVDGASSFFKNARPAIACAESSEDGFARSVGCGRSVQKRWGSRGKANLDRGVYSRRAERTSCSICSRSRISV